MWEDSEATVVGCRISFPEPVPKKWGEEWLKKHLISISGFYMHMSLDKHERVHTETHKRSDYTYKHISSVKMKCEQAH